MPAAARVKVRDFFTDQEWAPLAERSPSKGLWLIAHCWGTIFAAMGLAIWAIQAPLPLAWIWLKPLAVVFAIMVIGARQLGLAILMHDGAHGCLHPDIKVNDWVGEWLTGAPTNANLARYRDYHLSHHKFAQQSEDPDLGLSRPFPTTRSSLVRKAVRDLTGQTFYKQRIQPSIDAFRIGAKKGVPWRKTARGVFDFWKPFLITNGVLLAALSLLGVWWAYPLLWIVPMATWYPLVTRFRNIAEHACIAEGEPDPLRQARTTKVGPIERLLIAPYFVNYHCEHHMFMYAPCYSLPAISRLLEKKGVTPRMLTASGYPEVLKMASAKGA
jgi:fatty acid desaturase